MVGKFEKALACLCAVLLLLTMLPLGALAEDVDEPAPQEAVGAPAEEADGSTPPRLSEVDETSGDEASPQESEVDAASLEDSTVTWELSEDGVLTISGSGTVDGELLVKDFDPDDVRSIVVQEGITEIGPGVLGEFINVTSVHLPGTLKTINYNAFWGDVALKEITLPDGLQTIGDSAFAYTGLTSITIPSSVTALEPSAFSDCKSLERVTLNTTNARNGNGNGNLIVEQAGILYLCDTEQSYDGGASLSLFPQNYQDTEVTLPANVGGCSLTNVTIEKAANLQTLIFQEVPDGIDLWITVRNCPVLTELQLPDGLKTLYGAAVAECPALKTVDIPESVTNIDDGALGYNNGELVEGFTIKGLSNSPAELYAEKNGFAFESTGQPAEAYKGDIGNIHWSLLETGALILSGTGPMPAYDPEHSDATPWENQGISITSIELQSGITAFAAVSEDTQRSLRKLALGDTVKNVPIEALKTTPDMRSFYSLSILVVDANNPYLKTDGKALYTKDGKTLLYWALGARLNGYTIPETVEVIGPKAFAGVNMMDYPLPDIPATVKEIGERAFLNTHYLYVTLWNPDVKIGERAFGYEVTSQWDESILDNVYTEQKDQLTLCTFLCEEGSTAEAYAKAEGFIFTPFTIGGPCGIEGDHLHWELNLTNGTLTFSGKGKMMPFETQDDPPWAKYAGYVQTVDIGEDVLSISDYAFHYCPEKLKVTGGEGLTNVGKFIFFDGFYINLDKKYEVLNGILVGAMLIDDPALIGRYDIPEGVTAIAPSLFGQRTIKTVTLPSTLKRIGEDAFLLPDYMEGQTSIFHEITLPENIETIGPHAIGYKGQSRYAFRDENGDIYVEEGHYEPIEGYVIKGYSGTVAETYARENGFEFVSLGTKVTAEAAGDTAISGKEITVGAATAEEMETLRDAADTTFTDDFNKVNNVKEVVYADLALKDKATAQEDHTQSVAVTIGYPSEMIENNYWNYDYAVLHLNEAAGETEKVAVTPTKDGLVYQGTLSPFAIGYYEKNVQVDKPGDTAIVTFKTGDDSDPTIVVATIGEKLTKPADPTREGYTFGGWYAENSDTAWDFEQNTVTADVTLTAKWTAVEATPSASPSPSPSPSAEPSPSPSAAPSTTPSAQPSPAPSAGPSETPGSTSAPQEPTDQPATGDNGNMILWLLLMGASGIGICALCALRPWAQPRHRR